MMTVWPELSMMEKNSDNRDVLIKLYDPDGPSRNDVVLKRDDEIPKQQLATNLQISNDIFQQVQQIVTDRFTELEWSKRNKIAEMRTELFMVAYPLRDNSVYHIADIIGESASDILKSGLGYGVIDGLMIDVRSLLDSDEELAVVAYVLIPGFMNRFDEKLILRPLHTMPCNCECD